MASCISCGAVEGKDHHSACPTQVACTRETTERQDRAGSGRKAEETRGASGGALDPPADQTRELVRDSALSRPESMPSLPRGVHALVILPHCFRVVADIAAQIE